MNKYLDYFWSVRHQLAKYFVVGISGLVLDVGLLALFSKGFKWNPTIAVFISQILVLIYNFLLNKYWSFANKEIPHEQIVRYSILAVSNIAFGSFVMYIFNERLGYEELIVRIITVALSVSWNFFLYKYWVYVTKAREHEST